MSGVLGTGNNLTDVILIAGFNEITVRVTDLEYSNILKKMNITVYTTDDLIIDQNEIDPPDETDNNSPQVTNSYDGIIVLLMIVLIIILLLLSIEINRTYGPKNKLRITKNKSTNMVKRGRQKIIIDAEIIYENED
jgi:hypothetical protein